MAGVDVRPSREIAPLHTVALLDSDRVLDLEVSQSLSTLGLVVEVHRSVDSVLDAAAVEPPTLVLVATGSGIRRARSYTRALRRSDDVPPVAWWCAGPIPLEPLRADERPEATLFVANDVESVAGMVWRAVRQPLIRDSWSGAAFLGRLRGDLLRYPPFRLVFLAHRIGATGELSIDRAGSRTVVAFRAGTVVDVRGAPDLLADSGVRGAPGDDLAALVGGAIATGMRPDLALDRAAEGLGRLLAALLVADGGVVSFTGGSPSPTVPLPMAVPRMLAAGLAHQRPSDAVERMLQPLWTDRVLLALPDDTQPDRWGLDSLARGLLRKAEGGCTLDELVGHPRRPEAGQAVDLLLALGLLRLQVSPPEPVAAVRPPSERDASARAAPPDAEQRPPAAEQPGEAAPEQPVERRTRRPQTGFQFEARYLALLALAREGTTDPRSLLDRFAELEFPGGQKGADAAFDVGEFAFAAGLYEAAADFFQLALKRQPDHARARRRLRSRRLRVQSMSGGASSRNLSSSRSESADSESSIGDMIDDWFGRWRS